MFITLTVTTSAGTKHTTKIEAESPDTALDAILSSGGWLSFQIGPTAVRVPISQIAVIEATPMAVAAVRPSQSFP